MCKLKTILSAYTFASIHIVIFYKKELFTFDNALLLRQPKQTRYYMSSFYFACSISGINVGWKNYESIDFHNKLENCILSWLTILNSIFEKQSKLLWSTKLLFGTFTQTFCSRDSCRPTKFFKIPRRWPCLIVHAQFVLQAPRHRFGKHSVQSKANVGCGMFKLVISSIKWKTWLLLI